MLRQIGTDPIVSVVDIVVVDVAIVVDVTRVVAVVVVRRAQNKLQPPQERPKITPSLL